jgi:predicted pyridoxine 5'-phosphate oxidase superfamily flavin-nucleotide-binding protein
MGRRFQELAFTRLVKEHQQEHGSRRQYERMEQSSPQGKDTLGPAEQDFIRRRDGFYMASVSETGWPYVQHRGGPRGFVRVINPSLLGFADLRGNKQYISLGNFEHDNRVALFFMDYPYQTRLKILGRVEVHEHDPEAPALIESFRPADKSDVIERVISSTSKPSTGTARSTSPLDTLWKSCRMSSRQSAKSLRSSKPKTQPCARNYRCPTTQEPDSVEI